MKTTAESDKVKAAALEQILRVTPEPCEHFSDWHIHQRLVLDAPGFISYTLSAFAALADGSASVEMPPKQVFSDPISGGDFRVMPCVYREGNNIRKTVKLVGTNLAGRKVVDQITVGQAFLIDATDNFLSHSFDACLLSSARTGVCAALAVKLLGSRRTRIGIVGCGRVGYYSALYIHALGGVEQIIVEDVHPERARSLSNYFDAVLPDVSVVTGNPTETESLDVLVYATDSREALYQPGEKPVELVISLGADANDQSEIHSVCADQYDLFLDWPDTASYGDLRDWMARGLIKKEDFSDLVSVLRSGVVPGKPRLFVSTGIALLDNITIGYLTEKNQP